MSISMISLIFANKRTT